MCRQWLAIAALSISAAACARPVVRVPADLPHATCESAQTLDGISPAPVVRWTRALDDAADLAALRSWCRGVGPAVVAAEPAARPAYQGAPLVVISWNTHVGGGDLRALIADLRAGRLTDGVPAPHFVLLLQEVFRRGSSVPSPAPAGARGADRIAVSPPAGQREDVVSVAASEGLALFYVPSMRNGAGEIAATAEDRGNAILSSMPLADFQVIELPFERQRRVAVAARVRVPGQPTSLRVVSAHLDAMAGPGRLWVFASGARATQAEALADAIGDSENAVIGSDLNTWADGPNEPAVDILRQSFPDTDHLPAVPTFRLGSRLDYLFFRLANTWRHRTMVGAARFGSDHHPLIAQLVSQ